MCSVALLTLCAAFGAARADDADPPGRAARLSDAEGAVSLQPAGVQEWAAATLNRPLTTGDRLWSDQGSRAELDLGNASLRLGSNTGVAFLNLDDHGAQMQLSAGALIVSVRDLGDGESYEVDTPNIALSVQQPGVYRVDVNDAGSVTTVAVSQGAAQVATAGQTIAIGGQQSVAFSGSLDTLAWQSATLGIPDEFDNWSAQRERELAESASADYMPGDIPGAQDLDSNGQWQQAPEYGYVWVPTAVAVGWVPYRYGYWTWVAPWGWTWVDAAPWGYAPFHYGRWVAWNNGWAWVPPPRTGRPGRTVYAPALVAWVGGSLGGAVALSSVGWFPLGARELYVPANHVSPAYLRNVNITNTTNVDNRYITNINQANSQSNTPPPHYLHDTASAVSAVPRTTFISGRNVGAQVIELTPVALAAATATAVAPAIAPTRPSVLGPGAGRPASRPPAGLLQRPVVAHTAPPAAPAPFERQLTAMQANGDRPLTRSELAPLQPGSSLVPVKVVASRGTPVSAGSVAHGSAAGRARSSAAPAAGIPVYAPPLAAPSLAERERALQQTVLPAGSPRPQTAERAAANADVYAPAAAAQSYSAPTLRSDRPPSAQQHPSTTTQGAVTSEDPAPVYDSSASLPIYHFPPAEATPTPLLQQPEHTYRPASAPPAVQTAHPTSHPTPPPPATHASSPTHAQSSNEPRDSAPHGDRDSRERALR
jgi:hypothetical protein